VTAQVICKPLSRETARGLIETINKSAHELRSALIELYEGRGWEALGYANWRNCVEAEFSQSAAHMYRLLDAGFVDRNISPTGELQLPERHARELKALPDPDDQRLAYEAAVAAAPDGKVTAPYIRAAVTVLREVQATDGFVSVGGESLALTAAITEEVYETLARQREHIAQSTGRTRLMSAQVTVVQASDGRVLLRATAFDVEAVRSAQKQGATFFLSAFIDKENN